MCGIPYIMHPQCIRQKWGQDIMHASGWNGARTLCMHQAGMGPGHYVCIRLEWGQDIMYASGWNGARTLCMYQAGMGPGHYVCIRLEWGQDIMYTIGNAPVSLDRIVEVREGQCSEWFEQFPYEALEAQSFSILYEENSMFTAYLYNTGYQ